MKIKRLKKWQLICHHAYKDLKCPYLKSYDNGDGSWDNNWKCTKFNTKLRDWGSLKYPEVLRSKLCIQELGENKPNIL